MNRVLKDSHIQLYNKREEIARTKEQNDLLALKERENRKTIMDLLALNNSVEQHVKFSEGASPERFQTFATTHNGSTIPHRDTCAFKDKAFAKKFNPGINHQTKTPNILRTIYLENDEIAGLKAELNSVMTEIEQDRVAFEGKLHECRMRKSKLDEFARQEFLAQ